MYVIYQIQDGDTLESIANKTNTTSSELQKINGNLNIDPGKYIIVPKMNTGIFDIYKVQSGDNLYQISRRTGISIDDLAKINGLEKNDYIYPNQEIMIPKENIKVYVTNTGDTLNTLLNRFNINYDMLISQNPNIYLQSDQLITFEEENM